MIYNRPCAPTAALPVLIIACKVFDLLAGVRAGSWLSHEPGIVFVFVAVISLYHILAARRVYECGWFGSLLLGAALSIFFAVSLTLIYMPMLFLITFYSV